MIFKQRSVLAISAGLFIWTLGSAARAASDADTDISTQTTTASKMKRFGSFFASRVLGVDIPTADAPQPHTTNAAPQSEVPDTPATNGGPSVAGGDEIPQDPSAGLMMEQNALLPEGGMPGLIYQPDESAVKRMKGSWRGQGTGWASHSYDNGYYQFESYKWAISLKIGGFANPRSPYPVSHNFEGTGSFTFGPHTQLADNSPGAIVPNIVTTNPGPMTFKFTGFYSERTKNLIFTSMSPETFAPFTDETPHAGNKPVQAQTFVSLPLSKIHDDQWIVKTQATQASVLAREDKAGDDIQGVFARSTGK